MLAKINPLQCFNYIIVFFFLFFFRFLPPIYNLTPLSMQVVGVFIGVIYAWVTISIAWPSVLGVVAFALTDYMTTGRLFELAFGSQTMVLILCLLLLTAFVQQTELTDVILDALMSRKEVMGKPFLLLFYFLYAGFLGALVSNSLAVLIIFIGLFREMMRKTGIAPYSKAVPCFLVGMVYSLVLGSIALPFRSTALLGIGAYEAITGETMNFVRFTVFMFPLCSAAICAYVLTCKYIFRVDLSALASYEHTKINAVVSRRKRFSLIAVLATLLLLLVPSIIPSSCPIAPFFSKLGNGGFALLLLSILLILRSEGEPLMDLGKIARFFPWNVFFIMIFLLPLANAVSSDAVGLKQILADGAAALLQNIPSMFVIFVMVLLSALVTNFANNAVVCVVFVSIVATIGAALPYNLAVMGCLVLISSNISCFFPAANPMNTIVFSQTDIVSFRQEFKFGLLTCISQCIFLSTIGYLYGLIIF